jgi:hypothetical protein
MALPYSPILIGSGVLIVTIGGICGFAVAVKTRLAAAQLALFVGSITALAATGVVVSPNIRKVAIVLAYGILIGFPLYALFWTLYEFTERVVRA